MYTLNYCVNRLIILHQLTLINKQFKCQSLHIKTQLLIASQHMCIKTQKAINPILSGFFFNINLNKHNKLLLNDKLNQIKFFAIWYIFSVFWWVNINEHSEWWTGGTSDSESPCVCSIQEDTKPTMFSNFLYL